jgi:hypothetical protein
MSKDKESSLGGSDLHGQGEGWQWKEQCGPSGGGEKGVALTDVF